MNRNTIIKTQETETQNINEASISSLEPAGKKQAHLTRSAKTVLNMKSEAFAEKGLCDGITLNLGDACHFSCTYCYVPAMAKKFCGDVIESYNVDHNLTGQQKLAHADVTIRREDAIDLLLTQLFSKNGQPRHLDPNDRRVVFASTLVDPAGTNQLMLETAEACNLILENTNWQIRLLSKSPLLSRMVLDGHVNSKFRERLIFGLSLGTVDNKVAWSIERGAGSAQRRAKALRDLQDGGFRTFGMICPSLPQEDYDAFSAEITEAIRPDRCEHVWAEVINLRGPSFLNTMAALKAGGHHKQLALLRAVCGPGTKAAWEAYARATYEAHLRHIPAAKLRFLQYVTPDSLAYWSSKPGVVCLGKALTAKKGE